MTHIKDIIKSLGGPAKVGRYLHIRSQAVSLWAITGRIPVERVPELEELAVMVGSPYRAEDMRPDIRWGILRCKS